VRTYDKDVPKGTLVLAPDQIEELSNERIAVGMFGVLLLASGYLLVIISINNESRDRSRLETEVSLAREIQQSLLPAGSHQSAQWEVAGLTIPATEVGGDYYDIAELPGGRLAVAVVDVSGHGVAAGMMGGMTKSAFRLQLDHDPLPKAVLENVNRVMNEVTDRKTFVTFAYVLLGNDGVMQLATAGHPPFLHRNGNTIREIRTPNLPLGMNTRIRFKSLRRRFRRGDILVSCTDGILEASNRKGEQFGMERLKQMMVSHHGSARELAGAILSAVKAYTGSSELDDDATVVVVKF
jgi:sigma-B regulation protein RsbU (phosphoserine phosphatase)